MLDERRFSSILRLVERVDALVSLALQRRFCNLHWRVQRNLRGGCSWLERAVLRLRVVFLVLVEGFDQVGEGVVALRSGVAG